MTSMRIPVQMLGQSGCRLEFPDTTIYMDPYLSNSVQLLDAHDHDLERQIPIPYLPEKVTDADIVLITHAHIDHCDPHTLPQLALASPQARFVGPVPVLNRLAEWGIAANRLMLATEAWQELAPDLRLRAIPAAHPEIERDSDGNLACVGYLIDYAGRKLYLAGDTSVRQKIIDTLVADGPVHTAFLPVNEHNFFRGRRGIIGNMSVREAFQFAQEIGARQVVPVHWDMFAANAVDPDEIRLIHQRMNPGFALLIRPTHLNLGNVQVSIIIRTLNEARYLDELLTVIARQEIDSITYEVVLVDSGSTDGTLQIAERHGCRIYHITREEFSFGRALNIGCEAAAGEILVFISGHCVPANNRWLQHLCQPILDGQAQYTYGRQISGPESHYSERRIFAKYFPEKSRIPQEGFFCNNANSALLKSAWAEYGFDEELTGLEDMELAQRLVKAGGKVAYVAEAAVYHHHNETWPQVRRRFEREAIALQKIMPQVHVSLFDTLRYIASSIWRDWRCARKEGEQVELCDIFLYRWNQYWGTWKGNHEHRKLSHAEKEKYFFPD
ncbi:MBL fold metallo-hydrolase [Methylomarinovum caldicuralii]|nr:MBL fold metallo-hydrolase [Methylomarinovum caldicuralii]